MTITNFLGLLKVLILLPLYTQISILSRTFATSQKALLYLPFWDKTKSLTRLCSLRLFPCVSIPR